MPVCITNMEETICCSPDSSVGCDIYSVTTKWSYHYLSTVWICVCALCAMVYRGTRRSCVLCGMIHRETVRWCVATLVCVWTHTVL
jgi:hypothetical protein